ncbi:hypothetical protein CapIbe_000845 [Capra ibex]
MRAKASPELLIQAFWGGRWPCSAAAARCPAFPVTLRQHNPGLPQIEEAKRSRKGGKRPRVELSLPRRSPEVEEGDLSPRWRGDPTADGSQF